MTHASLFSGIGGFDLAAEWMGWTNTFNCEIDPFCRKVLAYHFPTAKQYNDVKTTDFTIHRGHIDVLTGGFPCQPFSLAGKRKGADDNRYLWPEMLRAIREIRPRWVVGENVLGIVNWSDGMVFEQVQADLETEGYEVQPFLIPACAVDAPHRRDRVWFVAHRRNSGIEILQREGTIGICESTVPTHTSCDGWGAWPEQRCAEQRNILLSHESQGSEIRGESLGCISERTITDLQSPRLSPRSSRQRKEQFGRGDFRDVRRWDFSKFPTQSPVCCGDDGLSDRLDAITFPAWRRESIKAYGNAVVPQIPYLIFQTIEQYEKQNLHQRPDNGIAT